MAVIVVTRLRLRDPQFRDDFLAAAMAATEQATQSPGSLEVDVLAEANDVYWTRTAWADRVAMRRFTSTEPHLSTMRQLDEWCDEASFVDWEQDDARVPDWQTGYGRLVADGQSPDLTHATPANATRRFPTPQVPS